jgi:hypothetical protein
MRHISLSLWVSVLAAAVVAAGPGEPFQSQSSFEAAIKNQSTSPSYVLITVVDDRSKSQRLTCTTSNLLMGAIHREYRLGYDEKGETEAERIALANRDHVFHFSKSKALKNIPISFSESDLRVIRSKLAPLSIEQLRSGFSSTGELHSIYQVTPWRRHQAYRDATACVLIERGLSPGLRDVSAQLWIAP